MAHRFPPQPVPSPRSFFTIKPVLELTEVINSGPAVYTQWKKDMEYRENVTRDSLTVAFALERNFFTPAVPILYSCSTCSQDRQPCRSNKTVTW